MRKLWIVLGAAVISTIIAILAFGAFFDVNRYRSRIEASLQEKFHREVHIGQMDLSLLPFGFRIPEVIISEDPAFGVENSFAAIDMLYVQPRVLSLLRGEIQIQSLRLIHPKLELIRNKDGAWNFTSVLNGRSLSVPSLRIEDGQVAVTDRSDREARAVYDHIDLTLRDYAPNKSFSLNASAHLPGDGKELIAFNGTAGPIQRDLLTRTPLNGKLELQEVALSALQRFFQTDTLVNSDAVLTGIGAIENNGTFASKGHIEIRQARLRGVELGYPITADYDVSSDRAKRTIAIRESNVKLNQTPI